MTENITIRLRKETMDAIHNIANQHDISKMLLVSLIIEKSLKDPKFSVEL